MEAYRAGFDTASDVPAAETGRAEIPAAGDYTGEKSFGEAFSEAIDSFLDAMKTLFGGEGGSAEAREFDKTMAERSGEVLAEVFDKATIEEWGTLSMEAREAKLDEYFKRLGGELGITATDVIVEDCVQTTGMEGVAGYNSHDGNLHMDYRSLENPDRLLEVLDTITHEARHQLQGEAIADPARFPEISSTLIEAWEVNNRNYIGPEWWPEGYYMQAVEVDARDFAAQVVEYYRNAVGL